MKQILISTAIALAIMLLPSAIRADERTIENKLTNLTWCFHRTQVGPMPTEVAANCQRLLAHLQPMPTEVAANCQRLLAHLQNLFGDNFDNALVNHAREMKELLSTFPEDKMTSEMMYNIIYAKRTDI